ncbi:uncharacterized protein LOC144105472 [Amblyomma americanum]
MHLLCESCYEQCAEDGGLACPLDHKRCLDGDVDWKDTPADEILKREVNCWNQENGCADFVAASEISRNFQRDCKHHHVFCPKCSASVARSDVCAHLKSDCRASVTPLASQCEGQSSFRDDTAIFSSFRRALEQQACEMKAFLEQLPADRRSRDDRLNEICHNMNAFKETLRKELTAFKDSLRGELADRTMREGTGALSESLRRLPEVIVENQKCFTTSVNEILACNERIKECLIAREDQTENLASTMNIISNTLKEEVVNPTKRNTEKLAQIADIVGTSAAESKEKSEDILHWTKQLLRMTALHADHCTFFVIGVHALKEAALKKGFANYFHETVYLRGYCISPGVSFKKEGDSVMLRVLFQLHKGDLDDSLTWPFAYSVKLSIIHPQNDTKWETLVRPAPFRTVEKPTGSSNDQAFFVPFSSLDRLTRDGYVLFDRLRVMWQLLL